MERENLGSVRIRQISVSEYSAAADCLIDSYSQDPLSAYLTTGDRNGTVSTLAEKKLERYMYESMITSFIVGDGTVEAVEEVTNPGKFQGVAAWALPGGDTTDMITKFRSGLWRLSWYMDSGSHRRFYKEFIPTVEETYGEIMKDCPRYWYLAYLGVRSNSQGKGYGRMLLESIIKRVSKKIMTTCTYICPYFVLKG